MSQNPQSPDNQLVKELFARASELPADKRAEFLDERCGHDPALRQAVEALLSAHDQAGEFLAAPTIKPGDAGSAELPAQRQVGPYKLLQVIGEGGFGTVYLAEQDQPVRRRVA